MPTKKPAPPPPADDVANHQYIVPALRRGLAVLRMFSADRRLVTVPDIVREIGVSRATAFRLAYTLEADGYLQKGPHTNAFQLGINLLSLGFEYLGSLELLDIARPILEDLRDRVDAAAHLAIQDGTQAVYVLAAPSRHRLRSNVTVGTRRDMHASSMGRVLMFDRTREDLRELFQGRDLREHFSHAPADADALFAELQEQRQLGYVAYRSRFADALDSVAAPVRDMSGRIVAGVNVSDYESIPAMKELEGRVKDEVLCAAVAISRGLGFRPRQVQR